MRRRAYLSIASVSAIAVISAVVLWETMFVQASLGQLGLGSVFLVSMLSHMTIVARDMFVPMLLSLSASYNPILLGIIAGWGGAFGDISAYFLGWGVGESIRGEQNGKEDRLLRWIKRYGLWAVFLFALTPLPDTPILILAGSSQLPFRKLLIVQGVGKSLLYSLGAFVGGFILEGLTGAVGSLYASTGIVVLSIAFCVLVTWNRSRNLLFGWLERLIP